MILSIEYSGLGSRKMNLESYFLTAAASADEPSAAVGDGGQTVRGHFFSENTNGGTAPKRAGAAPVLTVPLNPDPAPPARRPSPR